MATLTVRSLPDEVYASLKELAVSSGSSMEAEARDILESGVRQRTRWRGAVAADLSGPPELADIETPYVRSYDPPRDVEW
jgi:plasmid stability protein